MKYSESMLFGMALGAGLVYFLDPDKGGRRRALVRDQLTHAGHELEDAARKGARHSRNIAIGKAHELKASLTERQVDDVVLEERVRSSVGRAAEHARHVEISADDGTVTLRGAVTPGEVQSVVRAAKRVRGVEHVANQLDVRERAAADAAQPRDAEESWS